MAQAIELTRVEVSATKWLQDSEYAVTSVTPAPDGFVITVIGDGPLPDTAVFFDNFDQVLWYTPTFQIRVITGSVEPLPPPAATTSN